MKYYGPNWKPVPLTGGLGEPLDGRVHVIRRRGCDAPLCEYEGAVTDCDGCGGEFCQKHSEQEHHNCRALSNGSY